MKLPFATLLIAATAMLVMIMILQTRRISRMWLRWLPKVFRESIDGYFDPPPPRHTGVPDPDEIEVDAEASPLERRAANFLRYLLSFAHGLGDLEHYLVRFTIAFVVVASVALVLLVVISGILSL